MSGIGTVLKRKARALKRELVTIYLCWKDPGVPWYAKAMILLVLAYAASPVDLIPDFIPVIGYLDDLILLPLGILLVVRLIPKPVYARHRAAAAEFFDDGRLKRIGIGLTLGAWLVLLVFILKITLG